MVANHLIESNPVDENDTSDRTANLRQLINDAVPLLPQLLTGVDVNVQFNSITGFEYTREVSLFDLLDINLVHGWLYDPQDAELASVMGDMSYNQLVVKMAEALGAAEVKSRLSSRGLDISSLKQDQPKPADEGGVVVPKLSLEGVERQDEGEGELLKRGGVSEEGRLEDGVKLTPVSVEAPTDDYSSLTVEAPSVDAGASTVQTEAPVELSTALSGEIAPPEIDDGVVEDAPGDVVVDEYVEEKVEATEDALVDGPSGEQVWQEEQVEVEAPIAAEPLEAELPEAAPGEEPADIASRELTLDIQPEVATGGDDVGEVAIEKEVDAVQGAVVAEEPVVEAQEEVAVEEPKIADEALAEAETIEEPVAAEEVAVNEVLVAA